MSNVYNAALGYLITIRGLAAQLRLNSGLGKTNGVEAAAFLGPQILQYIEDADRTCGILLVSDAPLETVQLRLMLDLCLNIQCDLRFIDKRTGLSSYAGHIAMLERMCTKTTRRLMALGD